MNLELAGIFGAGMLTLVTPCVLPLIPIYLAILAGGAGEQGSGVSARLGLFFNTLMFALGMVLVFVALGLTATSMGGLLAEYRPQLVLLGGLVILLFGLKFLGVLKIGWLEREKRLDDSRFQTRSRLLNALIMGLVFGLGWTPCVGPILGSVLTYTASSTADLGTGALYLAAYGLGFTLPLLLLSLFADAARRLVRRISPWLPRLERVNGLLLVGVGLYLMLGLTAVPEATLTPGTAPQSQAVSISPPLGQPTTRPRMVQFSSPDCSICRQMIPTVAVIQRDCDGRKVNVVKVDVTNPHNRRLATRYRVRGVPTFVFLDPRGSEVARLVGYQKLPALRQALAAVVGEQCDGLGSFPFPAGGDEPPPASSCDDPGALGLVPGKTSCGG